MHGAVDPAVLAALTPSLQHDILVQVCFPVVLLSYLGEMIVI